MKLAIVSISALSAALGLAGCAGRAPAAPQGAGPVAAADHTGQHDHTDHHAQHGAAAATLDGPPARVVDLPGPPGAGKPRETQVLLDSPVLKLATIVLRQGTVLPEHHAPVAVTIQALQGAGTVVAGSERLRLDAGHAVVLAAKVPHSVEPDAGTDLVLLVHHLGQGEEHHD